MTLKPTICSRNISFRPSKSNHSNAAKARFHGHASAEFIHALRGKLELLLGEEENDLEREDALYFGSRLVRGDRGTGKLHCAVLVVTVP